jgi:hypothetical protein
LDGPRFDWDENNIRHLARHRISPEEAEQAILDPEAKMLEIQTSEGDEERVKAIGRTADGRILVTVFAFRGEAIRLVTAYRAAIREQRLYFDR